MSSVPKTLLSPEQYLHRERKAEFKSEFYRGEVFAMAGASIEHNRIVANLVREVGNALKDGECEIFPSDLRVRVDPSGLYTYPDAVVVCGDAEFADESNDTVTNPAVLFEVLSESTEAYDRGPKASMYRDISSLRELVLVAQDRISVECYVRQDDGRWMFGETTKIDAEVSLASLNIRVAAAEIYRGVDWETT